MRSLVLTVIGDNRAGLVAALAHTVTTHGGNWERSQMAELAGKFAGIVVVTIPDDQAEMFVDATRALGGLLDVSVHAGHDDETDSTPGWTSLTLAVLGNDSPGIVHELSTALSSRGLSIERMTTSTREAPMSGGMLFEAQMEVLVPPHVDLAQVRADLERLASELLVDLGIDQLPNR
jgi:glycine cleavage system regulatory protein